MTPRIEFTQPDWDLLEAHLLDNDLEQGAFCLAEPVAREGGLRLLVREVLPVPRAHLLAQTGAYLETDPLFFAPILKRARLERYCVVVAHSHPFSRGTVAFSSIDDAGEQSLIPKIQARAPGLPHAALVVGRGAAAARVYQPAQASALPARVRVVGWPVRDVSASPVTRRGSGEPRYHRQILAWGPAIQGRLADARIGLVGVGGTGSHVVQQLLHLGAGHLRVIDPDEVDESNLNRLVGATAHDAVASVKKVEVAARIARRLGRGGNLEPVAASVLQREVALGLAELDVVFGCTDDLETRQLLNRMSLQYLVPLIDLGVDLEARTTGQVRTGVGRVTVVLPDGMCLHRAGVLGGPVASASTGYVQGAADPAPAVVSFNGLVASLAVSVGLAILGAFPMPDQPRQLIYRLTTGRVMQEATSGVCPECQPITGVGDSRPLPWDWPHAKAL